MDRKPRVEKSAKAVRPLAAEELLVDQKPKNFPSKDLSQARVVDPGDLVEDARALFF
jgi:hypothetical protein